MTSHTSLAAPFSYRFSQYCQKAQVAQSSFDSEASATSSSLPRHQPTEAPSETSVNANIGSPGIRLPVHPREDPRSASHTIQTSVQEATPSSAEEVLHLCSQSQSNNDQSTTTAQSTPIPALLRRKRDADSISNDEIDRHTDCSQSSNAAASQSSSPTSTSTQSRSRKRRRVVLAGRDPLEARGTRHETSTLLASERSRRHEMYAQHRRESRQRGGGMVANVQTTSARSANVNESPAYMDDALAADSDAAHGERNLEVLDDEDDLANEEVGAVWGSEQRDENDQLLDEELWPWEEALLSGVVQRRRVGNSERLYAFFPWILRPPDEEDPLSWRLVPESYGGE